ncbi:hypothetical protein V6N13_065157 [Hibiscus sabdariffa]|uniref:Uncharacterized protein n=1 Tax=Hibiscus sabdariffa TaxID=183260 RepID=A0ABR2QRK6_9ROSI
MAKDQLQVLNSLDVAKTQWEGASAPRTLPSNVSATVDGRVYGLTLLLMVISLFAASGLSFSCDAKLVMATLCFFWFWLGFGFGILIGGLAAIVVSAAFKSYYPAPVYAVDANRSTVPEADYVWRIILMVGALPALITYYWRTKMPETAQYTALVAKNAKQAAAYMSKVLQVDLESEPEEVEQNKGNNFGLLSAQFLCRHGLHLLGAASTWFLLDIAFYSQNLFQKDICSAIGWIPKANTMNAIEEVYKIARAQTLIALCSTGSDSLSSRLRSKCHGISAASGKAGAMVGVFGFLYAADAIGVKKSLIILGFINFLGLLFTFLVPESKGKSLEEISGEGYAMLFFRFCQFLA